MNESELLSQAQSGSVDAAETLINNYKGMVASVARRYYIVGATQEDALQEGMIGLFNAVMTYNERGGKFSTYAYTCIRSRILDAVKSASRDKNRPLNDYVPIDTLIGVSDMEEEIFGNIEGQELQARIKDALNDKEYKVLRMYLDGKSYAEIASESDMQIKGVDNALQRIKKKIKAVAVG
ncbi:MAG: sigma-70 family RNA polymerase sigma factor [Clostridia bacterium]|nr:sigma-70 family RNA polymerase sigma factor [Clostridia bacterium]